MDLHASEDMTRTATAWKPDAAQPHDWETDPRPLLDWLREWQVKINGGRLRDSRDAAIEALRIQSKTTYSGLLASRTTPYEKTIRRLMTLIDNNS